MQGNNPDFNGPVTSDEIVKAILSDARARGIEVTEEQIRSVSRFFFRLIVSHMRSGDRLNIDGLGTFGMQYAEKKRRIDAANKRYYRKLHTMRKKDKRKRDRKKYRQVIRPAIEKKYMKEWELFNSIRREKGLKEWKFDEWRKVFHMYFPRGGNRGKKDVMEKLKRVDKRKFFFHKKSVENNNLDDQKSE